MRVTGVALFLVLAVPSLAQTKPDTQTVKVKIEATELDRSLLLSKLNAHGPDHGLKFESADQNYDYRITFSTEQRKSWYATLGSGGSYNTSAATASVADSKGVELFRFQRAGRGTDTGAANAVAKEIIKRLIRWWHTPEGKQTPGALPQ
jgi:hypothetical protein